MTKPTRDLLSVLLPDYHRLQKEKLFTQKDVDRVLKVTNMLEYGNTLKEPFDCTLYNAGHILGSTMLKINSHGGIIYTGDICMRKTRVLDACDRDISAKTLIVESTYGGKEDVIPSYKDSYSKMIKMINETIDTGGTVLIPSFAVGRAQEVLLTLDDYMKSGALRQCKIYVEGMINKTMRIYRHNAIYANEDIKRRILMSEDDPFKSKFFHQSKSKTREDVLSEPCIIVSTSGMLTGGPALFYLEKLASNPKNRIIFVGYQAEHTPGRKLLNGEKEVEIGHNGSKRTIKVEMKVNELKLSGHADYNELLQFIRSIKGLERVILVHGEKTDLKDNLEKDYEVIVPGIGESVKI